MAGERGAISVGDLVRVLDKLALPACALPQVAELLGLELPQVHAAPAEPAAAPTRPSAPRAAAGGFTPPSPAPRPEPPLPAPAERRPLELIEHPARAGAGRAPRTASASLEDLVGEVEGAAVAAEPLFTPMLERALVVALAAAWRPDGDWDVEELVPHIASGEPVMTIPRLPVLTTRLGVRVLVDVGIGMLPFRRDAERLVDRVERLVGGAGVERLDFDRSPLGRRGLGVGWDWKRWENHRPLAPGRPVLAVTDLGLGGRAAGSGRIVREWREFARTVAAARSPLVVLVPYPRERWPRGLRAQLVAWDRSTTVLEARPR